MKRFLCIRMVCYALLLLVVMSLHISAADPPVSEKQKIEALIHQVENLSDAVFIRNNKEYDAKSAAIFLRSKWKAALDDIMTAQEFITKIATLPRI